MILFSLQDLMDSFVGSCPYDGKQNNKKGRRDDPKGGPGAKFIFAEPTMHELYNWTLARPVN